MFVHFTHGLPSRMDLSGVDRYRMLKQHRQDHSNRANESARQRPEKGVSKVFQPLSQLMAQAEVQFRHVQSEAMARNDGVVAHEMAHLRAARHLAGAMSLGFKTLQVQMPDGTTRAVTYADSGSVEINMPGLPTAPAKNQAGLAMLYQALDDFKIVEEAAVAPGSLGGGLSNADLAIAQQAASAQSHMMGVISQSEGLMARLSVFQQQKQAGVQGRLVGQSLGSPDDLRGPVSEGLDPSILGLSIFA